MVQASLLPSLIGWGRTRELLYLADTYDAQTMYQWGFINQIFGRSELEHAIAGLEQKLAKVEPKALAAQKALMRVCGQLVSMGQWVLTFTAGMGEARYGTNGHKCKH